MEHSRAHPATHFPRLFILAGAHRGGADNPLGIRSDKDQ
jgi:hypothetical protein